MPGPLIRAFIAASLPGGIQDRLMAGIRAARDRLPGGRWTPGERLHLTLEFLGNISPMSARLIAEGLVRIEPRRPVAVRPAGTGGFPSTRSATVLWAGLDGGEELAGLAHAVREITADAGVRTPDDRPFVPHITIARFREGRDAGAIDLWGGNRDTEGDVCLLSRVVLWESRLSSAGPSYTALRDIQLAGGEHAGS